MVEADCVRYHPFSWREGVPTSTNILGKNEKGEIVDERGIRWKPSFKEGHPNDCDLNQILKKVKDKTPEWLVFVAIAEDELGIVRKLVEDPDLAKVWKVINPSLELIRSVRKVNELFEVLQCADYLIVNEQEAADLVGSKAPAGWLCDLADICRGNVIVTLAEKGVVMRERNGNVLFHPAFEVDVEDLTGAGDTFNAGFLSVLCQAEKPEEKHQEALCTGCAAAAVMVTKKGGGVPIKKCEVDNLRREYKNCCSANPAAP